MAKTDRQSRLAGFDDPPDAIPPLPTVKTANSPAAPGPACLSLTGKTVYLIDAHSLIYQVFHALPEMSGPTGQPVGAVHGFVRDMLDLVENRGADYLVAAFDHPGKTFRHDLYDQYKIHREEMPGDLQLQIPVIHQFLAALGIPALSLAGFEADDLLATIARQIEAEGGLCYLVTSDKDVRQLISNQIKIYNIRKNEIFDDVALMATWGITPEQVVDFQSLVGDSVDNVPGVALIGPKIAQELLAKYGTLDNVLNHAHEISGTKRKENLMNGRAIALQSRELVRLKTDVPIAVDWNAARVGHFRPDDLEALCRECGFRQLARRVEILSRKLSGLADAADAAHPAPHLGEGPGVGASSDEGLDSAGVLATRPDASTAIPQTTVESPEWNAAYRTIATPEDLHKLVAELCNVKRLSVDTETTSTQPRWAEIVGYSLAWDIGQAVYIPVHAPAADPQLDPALVRDALRPLLEDADIEKIGQNLKYDMVVLRAAGINLRGTAFDTMVADYLLDPGQRSHNLDDLAHRYLNHRTITIDQLIGTGKNQKLMNEVPVALVAPYAAEDADVPVRLEKLLAPRLHDDGLHELFTDLEMPLIEVLAELEFNGIKVDRQRLIDLSAGFTMRIDHLEREIYELAGGEFNIDSRLQLGKLLFEDFKLPILKKTKTGPSMDAEVLEELAALHPLPAKIIEYRQNAKLKSTYVDALQELIHPQTGRVHTSFKQDVAATGRLSSQDPNLQNIPIRTEQGREIRSAFLPGYDGWLLLAADYSQIELRVLAHFSGDATLRQAFADDRDIHALVAAEVYGVPLAEVTSTMRRNAKAVNFGVIYGQSPFGLAKSLRIEQSEAAEFIDRYFARYPGVDSFMLQTLTDCRKRGYVSTILGRRRPVSGVRDPAILQNNRQRNLPERIAVNTVIQGSAADIIKRAMINVHRRLSGENLESKMLLQIHDELVFECPPHEQAALEKLVREEMAAAANLAVPLKVDLKTGPNWAACE